MAQNSSIIFLTGGVRSGKSRFAEELAGRLWESSCGSRLHYIAAMQPSDSEMVQRITRHQEGRIQSGYGWKTWEKPVRIGELAPYFKENDVVLLDCLTTWLNNELFRAENKWQEQTFQDTLLEQMWNGITAISKQAGTLIIVSNEVLYEPIGSDGLVFAYSRLLGKLHQRIVANACKAMLVEAGIPIVMKGERK